MMEMAKEIRQMEVRASALESENTDDLLVEGRAIVYDSPTVMFEYDGIKYYEVIKKGALNDTDMKDVPFKYNHSDNFMIMARTRNKTLTLDHDDRGLVVKANLAKTTSGEDLYKLIKRGDIDKMSFAFTVEEAAYNVDTHTRTITKIKKLYDVSAVDVPAYCDTSISARSFYQTQAEAEKRALEEKENLRKKLLIKTYL